MGFGGPKALGVSILPFLPCSNQAGGKIEGDAIVEVRAAFTVSDSWIVVYGDDDGYSHTMSIGCHSHRHS